MSFAHKSSTLEWWLQGLAILIPDRLKTAFSPQKSRVLLQLKKDQLTVEWPETGDAPSKIGQYMLQHASDLKKLLNTVNQFTKNKHDYVLYIPANKGLRNTLKLPVNAESDLPNILDFEIDRQTPFTKDQVYSGYRLAKKDVANNALNVELNVIPKKMIDIQLQILNKVGLNPKIVELASNSGVSKHTAGINVLPHSASTDHETGNRRLNIFLSALATILLIIAIAAPFVQIDSELKRIETEIEETSKGAQEVNKLRTRWEAELEKEAFVLKKIDSRTSLTEMIHELTQLIPDDTWLTRIHLKEDTIRLQGESSSATSLISIIEQSARFDDTRFQSPVTNNISTGKDRFQITSKVVIPKDKEEAQ